MLKTIIKSTILTAIVISMIAIMTACSGFDSAGVSTTEPEYDVNLSDMVLYDKNDVKVTAKGFVYEGKIGGKLYLFIENNRDTDVAVVANGDTEINGIVANNCFIGTQNNGQTGAGKTSLYPMIFEDKEMENLSISKIANIKLKLNIHLDYNSGKPDSIDSSEPTEIVLSETAEEAAPEGPVVFDENGLRIVFVGYESGTDYYEAKFYYENNSGKDVELERWKAVESEYIRSSRTDDYNAGTKGFFTVKISAEDTDDITDVDYMMISALAYFKGSDESFGSFEYRVDFD